MKKSALFILFFASLLSGCSSLSSGGSAAPTANHLALLLPLEGAYAEQGQAIRDGFMSAYYQQHSADVKVSVINTATLSNIESGYHQATHQGATLVVGPLDKNDVTRISHWWSMPLTTLALNYATTNTTSPQQLYQFGFSPIDEAHAAAEKASHVGTRALMITPSGAWGDRIANTFQSEWIAHGGTIVGKLSYGKAQDLSANIQTLLGVHDTTLRSKKLRNELHGEQRRQDVDVIFLSASPAMARQIQPLLKFYYAGDIPVYATSYVYTGTPSPTEDHDLDGIIFCDIPWVFSNDPLKTQLAATWGKAFNEHARLYGLGIDAYGLSQQLSSFARSPSQTYHGVTGLITLDNQHRFQRQLSWAQFRNGIPVVIE